LSVVVFYLFAPETKNRTLEDIDMIFLTSKNALQPVKLAKNIRPGIAEELDISEKAGAGATQNENADAL
jgi:hypothetical protein